MRHTGLDDLRLKRPKVARPGHAAWKTYGHFCCIVKCAAVDVGHGWATFGPPMGHKRKEPRFQRLQIV